MKQITSLKMVSIIIPSYNHEKYVGFAIESVINQTYKNWELIVIDDGSTDGSVEEIKKYSQDSRIRYFVQENHDASYTINRGIKESKGEYIFILNSDDIFESNKLSEAVSVMEMGYDFVFAKMNIINQCGVKAHNTIERVRWINEKLNESKEEESLQKLFFNINYIVSSSNFAFRKNILERIGYFHEYLHMGHDYDFLIKLYSKSIRIKFIPQYLTRYRIHSENTISKSYPLSLIEACYSISKYLKENKSEIIDIKKFKDPVIVALLVYFSRLSILEVEDVISNKNNYHRLKMIRLVNKKSGLSFFVPKYWRHIKVKVLDLIHNK